MEPLQIRAHSRFSALEQQTAVLCLNHSLSDVQTQRVYKDKDLFIGQQDVVEYSKVPEGPQSSARPICHSHAMTRMGRKPTTTPIAA